MTKQNAKKWLEQEVDKVGFDSSISSDGDLYKIKSRYISNSMTVEIDRDYNKIVYILDGVFYNGVLKKLITIAEQYKNMEE